MSSEDRLNEILGRQAAEAARKRTEAEAELAKRNQALELRARVQQDWNERRADLARHAELINARMGEGGKKLHIGTDIHSTERHVEIIMVSFYERNHLAPRGQQSLQNLKIWVSVDGKMEFHIGTLQQSPVKHYNKNIFSCTSDDMMDALLDFLDANTPK